MWLRNPLPNHFQNLIVDGNLTVNGNSQLNGQLNVTGQTIGANAFFTNEGIDEAGAEYFFNRTGSTRTTFDLQVQPRMLNGWTTPASGVDALTATRLPDGTVMVSGACSNVTPANRSGGVAVFDFLGTAAQQTFRNTTMDIHSFADGKGNASGFAPVYKWDAVSATCQCFNFENTTVGSLTYFCCLIFNKYSTSGKYENSGGY
jgi:hypothetical protein